MYEELVRAAQWSAQQGLSDPERACVIGWGYGGYSSLIAAMAREPFDCAASVDGYASLDRSRASSRYSGAALVGDLESEVPALRGSAPLARAAEAQIPILLISNGKGRTFLGDSGIGQTKAMAAALGKAGKPYKLVLTDTIGDGHQRMLYEELEHFLKAHLVSEVATTH